MHLYTIDNYNMFCNTFKFKVNKLESLRKFKNVLTILENTYYNFKSRTFREFIILLKAIKEM